jgi:Na+-transporting NADH:ubiquinone oxidoreductase subunit B
MEATAKQVQKEVKQAPKPVPKKKLIKWQKPNLHVVYALIPASIASIYYFGWRSLLILAVVNLAGFLTEYLFLRAYYKEPVTSAVFVSSFIYTLSLPPTIPVWIAVVGIVFGITIGKMAFGGFGRNIFNPAMTGRAFVYVSFGGPLTAAWVEHIGGAPGGFGQYAADVITKATPLARIIEGLDVSRWTMFLGNESGCLGETSALLLLLGGIYITWRKFASWRIVLSVFLGMLIPQTIFWMAGLGKAIDPLSAVLGGGFMMGAWFIATDPVSAAQTNPGRFVYGALIGATISLIRVFSIWSGAVMFAVLLGNMFNPIVDYYVKQRKKKGVAT